MKIFLSLTSSERFNLDLRLHFRPMELLRCKMNVETQYYRELHSIDKQHHTTGSGFIRGVGAEGEGGHEVLKLQNGQDGAGGVSCIESRSNPATNDWVPKINEDQVFVSSKPNGSESS
ncbi:hypothetical protein I3842_02G170600 [Carya illinoinensis]|uniref:Uncharacterized protein n=2 Tax=Carya illinoinensis TaxID=32201 RepID=A0A922FX19_CARIL|nr:hypothetical protein I3842_02G170600 [Carya illinoinensis]